MIVNPLPPPRPIAQSIQQRVQQAAAQQGASQQMHQQPAAPTVSTALPIRIRELKLPEPRPYLGTKISHPLENGYVISKRYSRWVAYH